MSSQLSSSEALAAGLARGVLPSRWSITGRESGVPRSGASWITRLLAFHRHGEESQYRIFHHAESQVYFEEGFPDGR